MLATIQISLCHMYVEALMWAAGSSLIWGGMPKISSTECNQSMKSLWPGFLHKIRPVHYG
jgi:hypothetical protein